MKSIFAVIAIICINITHSTQIFTAPEATVVSKGNESSRAKKSWREKHFFF